MGQTPSGKSALPQRAETPSQLPCRTGDGNHNKDLFVMTLGDVQTPLADGTYNLQKDEVQLKDGTTIKNYYRERLGVKYYKPIDKSIFPLPPSGWCSWYYYYQEINETEVKRVAQWIAENLKDYGAEVVQIDDGWQGDTRGSRDWTTIHKQFPGGMSALAAYIKSLGLTPGIWLAPHGQSNEAVVKNNPGVFLLKPDGTSASESWEGKFLTDPTTPQAHAYLKDLFTTLSNWGYDYFKIDGQPVVLNEFRGKRSFMKSPADDVEPLYRQTLETIRSAIGPKRYLLGCWGTPLPGAGIMNGSRTGGDVVLGWGGFRVALQATLRYYYLHNIVWYSDPDVVIVRSPLTLDQAHVWAALQGLTGQALLTSDRVMDLSEDRVEMLRRIYPAVDIRPLDLFPANREKRIWDLKVNHLGRNYDVVGVFNFNETKPDRLFLSWKDLGLPETTPIHVFDFWNKEYLGAWEKGITVDLAPTSSRVLTLMPSTDDVQLISTNRHMTQGWVDLVSVQHNKATNSYSGTSKVIKNDPYELRFVFPRGKNFVVKKAVAGTLPVKVSNHQGWATVRFTSPKTTEVNWQVSFEPTDIYDFTVREPANLSVERVGVDGVNLRWNDQYYLNAGYQVYLNGTLSGFTPSNSFPLRGLDPNARYTVEVATVWDNGRLSEKKTKLEFTLKSLLPDELTISDTEPLRAGTGRGAPRTNRAMSGFPLSLGGKRYERGIGVQAPSEIEYDVKGLYDVFSAQVGVDDGNGSDQGSVEFVVLGDGKELWRSGVLKKSDGAKSVKLNISGVERLTLRVTDGGDGARFDHADWADAKLARGER
jgi:hypothetical protein